VALLGEMAVMAGVGLDAVIIEPPPPHALSRQAKPEVRPAKPTWHLAFMQSLSLFG
jgi:hypothetical protein